MLIISTHLPSIENQILSILCAAGWHLVAAVPSTGGRSELDLDYMTYTLGRITRFVADPEIRGKFDDYSEQQFRFALLSESNRKSKSKHQSGNFRFFDSILTEEQSENVFRCFCC